MSRDTQKPEPLSQEQHESAARVRLAAMGFTAPTPLQVDYEVLRHRVTGIECALGRAVIRGTLEQMVEQCIADRAALTSELRRRELQQRRAAPEPICSCGLDAEDGYKEATTHATGCFKAAHAQGQAALVRDLGVSATELEVAGRMQPQHGSFREMLLRAAANLSAAEAALASQPQALVIDMKCWNCERVWTDGRVPAFCDCGAELEKPAAAPVEPAYPIKRPIKRGGRDEMLGTHPWRKGGPEPVEPAPEVPQRRVGERCPTCNTVDTHCDCAERIACPKAGETGHWNCGTCGEHGVARFICGCHAPKPEGAPAASRVEPSYDDVVLCAREADAGWRETREQLETLQAEVEKLPRYNIDDHTPDMVSLGDLVILADVLRLLAERGEQK